MKSPASRGLSVFCSMIVLMIIAILTVLGLIFGSFINALVWRLHEQDSIADQKPTRQNLLYRRRLSILNGRSMCPHCGHELAAKDLVPVFSWLVLRGKCRYCRKPIGWQYPLVELLTAVVFILSYIWWPQPFVGQGIWDFIWWLAIGVILIALAVYDARWFLLPDKLVFPLLLCGLIMLAGDVVIFNADVKVFFGAILASVLLSGLFYVLFAISNERWIGGGDVKLGLALGLLAESPLLALLLLFIASLFGSLAGLPYLLRGKRNVRIPFGPFLIAATAIVVLFGSSILDLYRSFLLV